MAMPRPASLRYFVIVQYSPTAMIMTGADGIIQFANAETEHMLGYRPGELIGQSIDILVPLRFRKAHSAMRRSFLAHPSNRPMGAGRDLTALRRDGSEVPVEIGLTPIETGSGLAVLATIIDISDRKKTESAFMQRAAELEAVVNRAVDGIVMIDERGVIQWLNPAAGRLFGYDSSELIGQNVNILMPEPYRSEHDDYLRRYLRTGEAKIIGIGRAVEGQRKDGSMFPLDLAVSVISVAGKRHFAGFIHDLSERRKLQARLEELHADRLKTMGEMAAALAHEVNQPLTAVANYLRTAQRLLKLDPSKRAMRLEDVLDEAAKQAVRAGGIINNLREFAGRGEPNKTQQHLHELIGEAGELMAGPAKQAGVRVILNLTAPDDRVVADRVQIKQVLVNLMRNAVEAMGGRERRNLMISTLLEPDGMIQTDVADTGLGIPKDFVDRLFEPFKGTKTKGMGIGLSISRSIIDAHYGKIWAEPNPGGGTRFSFTLPLADGEVIGRQPG